jgi:hypothetical protein
LRGPADAVVRRVAVARRGVQDVRRPTRLLREGAVDEVGPQVLAAARQFAVVG